MNSFCMIMKWKYNLKLFAFPIPDKIGASFWCFSTTITTSCFQLTNFPHSLNLFIKMNPLKSEGILNQNVVLINKVLEYVFPCDIFWNLHHQQALRNTERLLSQYELTSFITCYLDILQDPLKIRVLITCQGYRSSTCILTFKHSHESHFQDRRDNMSSIWLTKS